MIDGDTGAALHDGNLERRYLDFVDAFGGILSYEQWLSSEIATGAIK